MLGRAEPRDSPHIAKLEQPSSDRLASEDKIWDVGAVLRHLFSVCSQDLEQFLGSESHGLEFEELSHLYISKLDTLAGRCSLRFFVSLRFASLIPATVHCSSVSAAHCGSSSHCGSPHSSRRPCAAVPSHTSSTTTSGRSSGRISSCRRRQLSVGCVQSHAAPHRPQTDSYWSQSELSWLRFARN